MPPNNNILPFPESKDRRLHDILDEHKKGNDTDALNICFSLVNEGLYEAYTFLAVFYEKGASNIEPDYAKAKFYYERSIEETGAVEAYLGLARMYYFGLGMETDLCKAWSIYNKLASEADNPVAHLILGKMYCDGLYVDRDTEKAKYYYSRAWALGNIFGLTLLGLLEQQSGNFIKGLLLRLKAGIHGSRIALLNPKDPRLRTS